MANTKVIIDTVGLGIPWSLNETYRVAVDPGFVEQDGGLRLPLLGNTSILSFSTPANPPRIGTTSPTHTGTADKGFQNVSFNIDRNLLTVLGGNVGLYKQGSPNVLIKTHTVNSGNTTGNLVTFGIVGNIEANQNYYVTLTANTVQDRDGFKNSAVTTNSAFRFVAPTAPNVTSSVPANNATAEKSFQTISFTFDRTVSANIGSVYLYQANTNALIKSLTISNSSISNDTVTMNIVGNILANERYYVRANSNIVVDNTLISSALTGNIFVFTSPTTPNIISTIPANATVLNDSNVISLTFDRTITANQGNVFILDNSNQIIKRYNVLTDLTTISPTAIGLNVGTGLTANTAYRIIANSNIVVDGTLIASNITGNILTFTSTTTPVIISAYPNSGNVNSIENQYANIRIDQTAFISTGNVYLKTAVGNNIVKTFNSNNITINQANISLDIRGQLNPSTSYYISSDANSIQNRFDFDLAGLSSTTDYTFTTADNFSRDYPNTFILGQSNLIGNTNYTGNVYNLYYRTIGDITVTSNNALGTFTKDSTVSQTTGYAGSAGTTSVRMGHGGGAGSDASSIFNLKGRGMISGITGTDQTYGVGQESPSVTNGAPGAAGVVIIRYISSFSNASATGGNVSTFGAYNIHSFTSNGVFSLTADSPTIVEYLIVGGGGGSNQTSGGGGGGGVMAGALELSGGTYTVTVGSGGGMGTTSATGGVDGTASSALGITARGGEGGALRSPNDVNGFGAGGRSGNVYITNPIGIGQIQGNLQQTNAYLSNITIQGNTTPYNINYRLINGASEYVNRIYSNSGQLSYASTTSSSELSLNPSIANRSIYFPNNVRGTMLDIVELPIDSSGNWTYEAWVYNETSTSNEKCIFDTRFTNGWMLRQNGTSGWIWLHSGSGSMTISTGRVNNAWQHLALVRNGSSITLFADGTSVGTTNPVSVNVLSSTLRIGAFFDTQSIEFQFNGSMDDIRVSNVARYTTSFTPSTSAFTSDANTLLLLNCNSFKDSSSYNKTVAVHGTLAVDSTRYKF